VGARNDRVQGRSGRWVGHREPRNHLLEVLTPVEWASVEPLLDRVDLTAFQTVELPGEVSPWLHFPESAIISVVNIMARGREVEVGTVGNEGMSGLTAWHEAEADDNHSVCSAAGSTLRARASDIIAVASQHPAIRRLLGRYSGAYLTLVAQGAACNRIHGLEQRCARLLLMMHDRLTGSHVLLTRGSLSVMLGVPTSGATLAIRALRGHGVIRASRERVDIVDRDGLERLACECYLVVRDRFATLT
jgi:CRP-like cAMP-binding protein